MRKIYSFVLFFVFFALQNSFAFVPATGVNYYIIQRSCGKSVGTNSSGYPALTYMVPDKSQYFHFVTATDSSYYVINGAGKYLSRSTANTWDISYSDTAFVTNGFSKWYVYGSDTSMIRLRRYADQKFISSDSYLSSSRIYSDKASSYSYATFLLRTVNDKIAGNLFDGTFEKALANAAPLGSWVTSNSSSVESFIGISTTNGTSKIISGGGYQSGGSNSFMLSFSSSATNNYYNTISQGLFNLITPATYTYSFNYKNNSGSALKFNVYAASSANAPVTSAIGTVFTSDNTITGTGTVQTGSISFTAPASNCYIVFREANNETNTVYIDNITMSVTPQFFSSSKRVTFSGAGSKKVYIKGAGLSQAINVTAPAGFTVTPATLPSTVSGGSSDSLRITYSGPDFATGYIRLVSGSIKDSIKVTGTTSNVSTQYRSKVSGDWNSTGIWEMYDNTTSSWISAVEVPDELDAATIQSGHTVTLSSQAGIGELNIASGAVLNSSTSAYTSAPVILKIGKINSLINNNGLFGCAIGSAAGTIGDGISLVLSSDCVSFSLNGSGQSGIGNIYPEAGLNYLNAVINQDVQLRYSSNSANKTALTLTDPFGIEFSGSRTLTINEGKTVSFLNKYSCLHGTEFSSDGSYSEKQGNITYNIQGTLDLQGGNTYITSSRNAASSTQIVKLNVGKNGKLIAGGDFNICKVQATQAVYVNLEDGALLDASFAATTTKNFYGPSTNTTMGYGSNYVWVITNGSAKYKRLAGYSNYLKVFNVTIPPADGNYVSLLGNPVSIGTWISNTSDVYTVGVSAGQYDLYPVVSFDKTYASNRMWTVIPSNILAPVGIDLRFGFNGVASESMGAFSPTLAAVSGSAATLETTATSSIPKGTADLCLYVGDVNNWYDISPWSYITPVTGIMGTNWDYAFYVGSFVSPFKYIWKNKAAPIICH